MLSDKGLYILHKFIERQRTIGEFFSIRASLSTYVDIFASVKWEEQYKQRTQSNTKQLFVHHTVS